MKLNKEINLPQYITNTESNKFTINQLKNMATNHVSKLVVETFWINLYNLCVNMKDTIDHISIEVHSGSPYNSFRVSCILNGANYDNVYNLGDSMIININFKSDINEKTVFPLIKKVKSKLKIGSISHKLIDLKKYDSKFSLSARNANGLTISADSNIDDFIAKILPDGLGLERQIMIERNNILEKIDLNKENNIENKTQFKNKI